MYLVFPMKPLVLPLVKSHSFYPLSDFVQYTKIQCELEGRVNGALFGDFDPGFRGRYNPLS